MIVDDRKPAAATGGAWWRTSSYGDMQWSAAQELSTLGEHLQACRLGGGPLVGLGSSAEALLRHVTSRFVTTLALAGLLIALGMVVA